MIDSTFWKNVKKAWIIEAAPKTADNGRGESSGDLDGSVPFDMLDYDSAFNAMMNGQDYISGGLETGGAGLGVGGDSAVSGGTTAGTGPSAAGAEAGEPVVPAKPKKPPFDSERFAGLVEKGDIFSFSAAFNMLADYGLPMKMEEMFRDIADSMVSLDESIKKFEGIYTPDMSQFYDYYIPEALELASTYVEYASAEIDEEILVLTEKEVLSMAETLITGLNDKKNELYQYGSMELKARAKALESIMGQNGHVKEDDRL